MRIKYIIPIMMLFIVSVYSVSANSILVVSEVKVVRQQDDFTINITCNPNGRFVRGWELNVKYDPTILVATSVREGNFYEGFNTFHSLGTINNTAGTIINIYSLIVGQGNISSAGTLISINFTSKSVGTSTISLYDIGICNETIYAPLSITNGSVTSLRFDDDEEEPPINNTIPPVNDTTPYTPSTKQPTKQPDYFYTIVFLVLGFIAIYIIYSILTRRK